MAIDALGRYGEGQGCYCAGTVFSFWHLATTLLVVDARGRIAGAANGTGAGRIETGEIEKIPSCHACGMPGQSAKPNETSDIKVFLRNGRGMYLAQDANG